MKLKKYQEDTLSAISAFYLDEDERTRFVGRGAWQARLEY